MRLADAGWPDEQNVTFLFNELHFEKLDEFPLGKLRVQREIKRFNRFYHGEFRSAYPCAYAVIMALLNLHTRKVGEVRCAYLVPLCQPFVVLKHRRQSQ